MTMIADLRLWNDSVTATEEGKYDRAVELLETINQKSSKTLYNTACCLRAQHKLDAAVKYFTDAVEKDEHMAIGYFQRGNTYFKLNKKTHALQDFEKCVEKFRGRKLIDYNQLGLKYKFYVCEPLHNAGCMNTNKSIALDLLHQAQSTQAEPRHTVIQDNIRAIQSKLSNLSKKDYLGKAKVVSAVDWSDDASGFEAPKRLQNGQLNVNEIKQKSTSAPNSPLAKHRQPSHPQVPRKTMEGRQSPVVLLKSGSVNQNLGMTSLIPEVQQIQPSKSDSSINQISVSGNAHASDQRPPDYRMPWQNRKNDGYDEKLAHLQARRPSLPQNIPLSNRQLPSHSAPVRENQPERTESSIPPPPNRPIPPRPKLPGKMRNSKDPATTSSQTAEPTKSSRIKERSTELLKPENLSNPGKSTPALPPKPVKPQKPAAVVSTEQPIPEFQALRAALKPVGQRVPRTKPD